MMLIVPNGTANGRLQESVDDVRGWTTERLTDLRGRLEKDVKTRISVPEFTVIDGSTTRKVSMKRSKSYKVTVENDNKNCLVIDRSFVFIVFDKNTSTVHLVGKVNRPAVANGFQKVWFWVRNVFERLNTMIHL